MTGFADGEVIADVGGRDEAEAADKGGGAVGEDVAVEVGGDDNVVAGRLAEEFVDHGVDDLFFDGEVGVFWLGEGGAGGFAEEAVGLGEDVAFVGYGDEGVGVCAGDPLVSKFLSPERDLARYGGDTVTGALRDALDGFCDFSGTICGLEGSLFFHVEVLGVFSHDDQVNWRWGGRGGLHGAHVGVEI